MSKDTPVFSNTRMSMAASQACSFRYEWGGRGTHLFNVQRHSAGLLPQVVLCRRGALF